MCPRCQRRPAQCKDGRCSVCHAQWLRLGRPAILPPPKFTRDKEGRLEDLILLFRAGVTTTREQARRLGVTERTVTRYRKELRQ